MTPPPYSLYERLQLDMGEKFHFLSENPGHAPSTIGNLHKVCSRRANIRRANIPKTIVMQTFP